MGESDKPQLHLNKWLEQQAWPFPYDFIVATPPVLSMGTYHAGSVCYRSISFPYRATYFEKFYWGESRSKTTTRSQLKVAYLNLVWMFDDVADLYLSLTLLRLEGERSPEYWRKEPYQECDILLTRLKPYIRVIGFIVYQYQYELDKLSSYEKAHIIPKPWEAFSGPVSLSIRTFLFAPNQDSLTDLARGDYVFQLCRVFLKRPHFCPVLSELCSQARDLIKEVRDSLILAPEGKKIDEYGRNQPGLKRYKAIDRRFGLETPTLAFLWEQLTVEERTKENTEFWPFAQSDESSDPRDGASEPYQPSAIGLRKRR